MMAGCPVRETVLWGSDQLKAPAIYNFPVEQD